MSRRIGILLILFVLTWAGLAALYGQTPAPRVGCQVAPNKIFTGGNTNFTIFADQLPPLTAYTVTLFYSPLLIQFTDQDLNLEEINLALGPAFPADKVTHNVVDPILGQIQLAVSVPVSSSIAGNRDVLATGYLSGIGSGVAHFVFDSNTYLLDHNGVVLNSAAYARENCWVEVGDSGTPTPEATATKIFPALLTATPTPPDFTLTPRTPTSTATFSPLPTQSPLQTPTPTSTPPLTTPENTATPTWTPFPTATPTDTNTPEPTPTDTETPTPTFVIITEPGSGEQNGQSPLETPTPFVEETPTETPVPTPTPSETPTETPLPTDTPTVEVVPPTDTPTATHTPIPTLEPTPTPTPLPQTERLLGDTLEVVNQSAPPAQVAPPPPYRLLAAAALFGGLALLLAFWQLRQRG